MVSHVCKRAIWTIDPEQWLYIDSDASEGYWNYLGMIDNETWEPPDGNYNIQGAGYEKK